VFCFVSVLFHHVRRALRNFRKRMIRMITYRHCDWIFTCKLFVIYVLVGRVYAGNDMVMLNATHSHGHFLSTFSIHSTRSANYVTAGSVFTLMRLFYENRATNAVISKLPHAV